MISRTPFSPDAASVFTFPSSTAWNGCLVVHSGCSGTSAFTLSNAKMNWIYVGCSGQSVPSLSKAAIRFEGGTKSAVPSLVIRETKFNMADFADPSLQDLSGSSGMKRQVPKLALTQPNLSKPPQLSESDQSVIVVNFINFFPCNGI